MPILLPCNASNECECLTFSSLFNTWHTFIKSMSLFHLLFRRKKKHLHKWLSLFVISRKRKRNQSFLNAVCKIKYTNTCRKIYSRVRSLIHVPWVTRYDCFPVADVLPRRHTTSKKLTVFLEKNRVSGAEKIAHAKQMALVARTPSVVRVPLFLITLINHGLPELL